jgi:hypothetical protein
MTRFAKEIKARVSPQAAPQAPSMKFAEGFN